MEFWGPAWAPMGTVTCGRGGRLPGSTSPTETVSLTAGTRESS